jgi:uncharacterized protein YwgA
MKVRDVVLLTLDALGGEISGKTRLHKAIYFLGELTGTTQQLGYRAHYYGPYSGKVDNALDELASIGLLDRKVQRYGYAGDRGFEKVRYDFELTEDGKTVAQHKRTQSGEAASTIDSLMERLKEAGDLGYVQMATAAKLRYLVQQSESDLSYSDVKDLAGSFGWELSDTDINRAIRFLQQLNLIEVVQD